MTLAMYVAQNLPYTSQTYDSSVPVPLLSADDAAAYDGGFFKICGSSPQVAHPSATLCPGGGRYGSTAHELGHQGVRPARLFRRLCRR